MNRQALKAQLTKQEGYKSHVYKDTKGLETIGVGRNIAATGPGLRDSEIALMLENDITENETHAREYHWYSSLDDARQNVIVNLIFNMGPNTFSKFTKFHSALSLRQYEAAGAELKDSLWYTQVGTRGPELITQLVTGKMG